MTQQQLATMLQHPDAAVRTYAVRHARELLARGDEGEPRDLRDGMESVFRGSQEFPELDLMGPALWHVYDFYNFGIPVGVAWDLIADRRAHALEVAQDVWYVYHTDLALLVDWPDLPL